jgi:hypothetical protein
MSLITGYILQVKTSIIILTPKNADKRANKRPTEEPKTNNTNSGVADTGSSQQEEVNLRMKATAQRSKVRGQLSTMMTKV